ncbi:hypothetical protein ACLKA6_001298, partial [Drosophila palustris]
MFARKEKIMTHVLTGEVKQRGRGAVQGTRTSVPPTTRAAQHNYSISGHHKRASSRRLFFSALDHQVTSRSPLKHALASVTQLTTACALHLGAFALSPRGKSTICDWYSNFKRGRTSTEDSKRSGRPKEVIIPEIIRQVRQIVLTDRRVKVREIAETVGISTGSAVSILHDHLHMKKLNVKWVPHFLDIEQREKRVADSKSCLDMFNRNPSEFLRRYITMDETWIHHYIPESNRSSAEWREAGESRSKRVKASRWA